MVAPLAFVVDVDALFALAVGFHHRAVSIDDRFVEECLGLLAPDLQPRGIEHFQQGEDRPRRKPPAEVAGRGGIGNPPRAERVQVDFVVTPQFQMFQAGAAGQQVVGHVQHVVRFAVRQIEFEDWHVSVDRRIQSQLLDELLHQADAAGADGLRTLGDFVVDVGRTDHRTTAAEIVLVQPPLNPTLAFCELPSYLILHSKALRDWDNGIKLTPLNPARTPGVFEFFCAPRQHQLGKVRWIKD